MKFRHKRLLKLIILAFVLMAVFNSFLYAWNSPDKGHLLSRYVSSFKSSVIKVFTYRSENVRRTYDEIAEDITEQKMRAGAGRSLYFLTPGYSPQTEITTPDYFKTTKGKTEKPMVQVYDPRFTLSIYYEWIRLNPGKPVPFHWSDWLNLEVLNDHIFRSESIESPCQRYFSQTVKRRRKTVLPLESYCVDSDESPLGFKITKFPGAHNKFNAILLAKSYLYLEFASPSRLVFLTNSRGAFVVEVEKHENDLANSLLHNGMPEDILGTHKQSKLDVLQSYKSLLETAKPQIGPNAEPSTIHLEESWFEMDINRTMNGLHNMELSKYEQKYFESLKYSSSNESPEKALYEAEILPSDRQHSLGRHYDWRFFDGYSRGSETQLAALHRMVRTYLKFCRTNGLVTWIAHGSLLSWYWNGLAFPWDLDADVQMPIRDLHRLARDFNQTLVLENAGHDLLDTEAGIQFNGMGAYFIDVGSSITHRDSGNGLNKIDARFVDIHTGLYVDITGLAVTDTTPSRFYAIPPQKVLGKAERKRINKAEKLYNCRNNMWASLKELSPLTKTLIDNEVGYVPRGFQSLLGQEYEPSSMEVPRVVSHEFVKSLRLWVNRRDMLDYLRDPKKWVNAKSGLKERDVKSGEVKLKGVIPDEDGKYLLYEENILREYVRSSRFTKFHETQMEHLLGGRHDEYFSEIDNYEDSGAMGRALWEDSFIRKVALNEWNRNEEMKKIDKLQKTYQQKSGNKTDNVI